MARLNRFNLPFAIELSPAPENTLPPIKIVHKIEISSTITIEPPAISLSLKNPPGYFAITMVMTIINSRKPMLLYDANFEKLSRKLLDFDPVGVEMTLSGSVKRISRYKREKTAIKIVSSSEYPKYF
jgi:hypothetical protein